MSLRTNKINEGNPNGDSTQKPGEEPAASTPTNAADASGSGDDSNWDEIMSGDTDKHFNEDGSGHNVSHEGQTEEDEAKRTMLGARKIGFRNLVAGNGQENSKQLPPAAAVKGYRQDKIEI